MLDRELIFCCFVASGCGTSNGRTISGAIKCNLCCHRSEREGERETETRTETIKYFRINATRWLLLIKCQNRQHQLLVWRLKISIITGWKSFTALPALFAWRSYLCIWVTFLTGAGKQNHINTSDISVCSLCACNCAVVPIRNVQINMNFRATVDKPDERPDSARRERRGAW